MRMPSCEPRPVHTIRAVGVASPSAHGHAMIKVATAAVNANSRDAPVRSHTAKAMIDNPMTIGTKIAETRKLGVRTNSSDLYDYSTADVQRGPRDAGPHGHFDGNGFARQHARVDCRRTLDD